MKFNIFENHFRTVHVVLKGQPLAVDDNTWEIVNDGTANTEDSTTHINEPSTQTEIHEKC